MECIVLAELHDLSPDFNWRMTPCHQRLLSLRASGGFLDGDYNTIKIWDLGAGRGTQSHHSRGLHTHTLVRASHTHQPLITRDETGFILILIWIRKTINSTINSGREPGIRWAHESNKEGRGRRERIRPFVYVLGWSNEKREQQSHELSTLSTCLCPLKTETSGSCWLLDTFDLAYGIIRFV